MNIAAWFVGHALRPVSSIDEHHFAGGLGRRGMESAVGAPAEAQRGAADGDLAERCTTGEVWVVLTGAAVDGEVVTLACAMAQEKHAKGLHALYCIEVPRSMPVDAELPVQRGAATEILDRAAEVAAWHHIAFERECLQARIASEGIVQALEGRSCATLVVGVPYRTDGDDRAQVSELAAELLRFAPCRVYVVRGMPQAAKPISTCA